MFNLLKNEDKAKDPVCGMAVNINKTKFLTEYKGKTYYFCSKNCKMTFDENKEIYIQ